MQFFAQKGLLTPIDDLWKKIGSNYTAGFTGASTGLDGKKYLVPTDWYHGLSITASLSGRRLA